MFLKLRYLFFFSVIFISAVSCSNSKNSDNDESNTDKESDSDVIAVSDSDEQEDTDTTDEDIADIENDENTDDDADSIEPVIGVTGNIWVETGSLGDKDVTFYECGASIVDQTVKTDSQGYFEVETELESGKSYCVESGKLVSCFTASGESHKANINPLTTLALILQQVEGGCDKLRSAETKVRKYMKTGTGLWLGELEYKGIDGVQSGFESVKGLTGHVKMEDILSDVAYDIVKTAGREYEDFFNGFSAIAKTPEVIIENATSPVELVVPGGSDVTAPGFRIEWMILNQESEGAVSEIWSDDPGEFTIRAYLYEEKAGTHFASGSTAVTFYRIEQSGAIDVSDMSSDFSYWVSDGAVAVFAAGTEITNSGNTVEEIEYRLLSSGGSSIVKVEFTPSGTVFANDPMFFIIDLGLSFSGDPIMLGVERNDGAGGISVLNQASGDPIMLTASGDPIMFTASGDPIMNIASGDPIMYGNMSNVLVTSTTHFSDFTVRRKTIPVNTAKILDSWTEDRFNNGTPYQFITESVTDNKTPDPAVLSKFFENRGSINPIEGDVDRLFNMAAGNLRNFYIFENYFYIDSMIKRFKARKSGSENEKYAAVYKGFDIRNVIYELYLSKMSPVRAVAADDLFEKSLVPETFRIRKADDLPDIRELAIQALLKTDETGFNKNLVVTKKDALDLLNYITLSGGPDFGVLNGALTPDTVICMWLSGKSLSECKTAPALFSVNSDGKVEIDGTEVTETQIDVTFSIRFKELPEMSLDRKHNLFRTLYLMVRYAANLYENAPAVTKLTEGIKETVFMMFDGMETGEKAIKLSDSIDNSYKTVSVINGESSTEVPIFPSILDLLGKVKVIVPSGLENTDVINSITLKIGGHGYNMETGTGDERPVYDIGSDMGFKTFSLKDVDYSGFPENQAGVLSMDLATLFEGEGVNAFGDCFADVSIILVSTVDGNRHIRIKNYRVNVGSLQEAESYAGTLSNSPVNGEMRIMLYNDSGESIKVKNGGVVIMPGNIVLNSRGGSELTASDLKPAVYVIEGFAEGYYPLKKSVVLNKGAMEFVSLELMPLQTVTDKGTVQIGFNKRTAGGGTAVLSSDSSEMINVFIVDSTGAIVKEFKNHSGADNVSAESLNYGQYTVKVVSDKFYTALQSIAVTMPSFEVFITLETKNICGNKIVETGEDCDNGFETGNTNLKCKDVFSDAVYPENTLYCDYSCTYNSDPCYNISK